MGRLEWFGAGRGSVWNGHGRGLGGVWAGSGVCPPGGATFSNYKSQKTIPDTSQRRRKVVVTSLRPARPRSDQPCPTPCASAALGLSPPSRPASALDWCCRPDRLGLARSNTHRPFWPAWTGASALGLLTALRCRHSPSNAAPRSAPSLWHSSQFARTLRNTLSSRRFSAHPHERGEREIERERENERARVPARQDTLPGRLSYGSGSVQYCSLVSFAAV